MPIPSKVQVTYSTACRFVSALGYQVNTEPDAVNFLALEGAQPHESLTDLVVIHDNPPGVYNDSLILFGRDAQGEGWSRALQVTTEPSKYYTEVNPHAQGAANLVWGHHLYKRGRHRGRPALVSASGVDKVWRDRNGDYIQDYNERIYIGKFGIHIHSGGKGEEVGGYSAGCIAVKGGEDGEPWQFLLEKIRKHPGQIFNLVLWSGQDLASWVASGVDNSHWRPTLYSGIQGVWVARLQRALNERLKDIGSSLIEDGDWGCATQQALDTFCDLRGLSRTCKVDVELWRRLGV
jgi:hypothetical protein